MISSPSRAHIPKDQSLDDPDGPREHSPFSEVSRASAHKPGAIRIATRALSGSVESESGSIALFYRIFATRSVPASLENALVSAAFEA
jgi:hypothetical protein